MLESAGDVQDWGARSLSQEPRYVHINGILSLLKTHSGVTRLGES